jgi:hypothetical protein
MQQRWYYFVSNCTKFKCNHLLPIGKLTIYDYDCGINNLFVKTYYIKNICPKIRCNQFVLVTVCLIITCYAKAQQSIHSSGANALGSGGTVSFSVGQAFYTSVSDSIGTVSQGVQQAYEIFTVGIKETKLNISLSVFPNPTTDNLTLLISDYNNEELSYHLFDIQGKLLSNGQVTAKQTQINTTNLTAATYFISVVNQENQKIQTFKIVKK